MASPLGAALAHHSFSAEFDAAKPVKLTGIVTKVEWTNPHVWFYINVKDNNFLDKAKARDGVGYCVFGRVIEGKEVVDAIEKVKTGRSGFHDDVPLENVVIERAVEVAA